MIESIAGLPGEVKYSSECPSSADLGAAESLVVLITQLEKLQTRSVPNATPAGEEPVP